MSTSAQVRSGIALQLDLAAEFLERKDVVKDTSPIRKAASACRSHQSTDTWGYRIDRLIFHKVDGVRVQSHPINSSNISLEVSIDIEGLCNPDAQQDPLIKLNMDFLILSKSGTAMSAWHLDRHEGAANFLHPSYHFQFGGKSMKYEHQQYGAVLIMDTPRIPHPPMDGILGIDFILVNFWEAANIQFRKEGEYANRLNASISMLWKPYIEALHGYWLQNAHLLPWKPHENWHQLPPKII